MIRAMEFDAPIVVDTGETVQPGWIDYNDHMNVAYYLLAFDQALDRLYDRIGMGRAYREKSNFSTMTLESHICYLRELTLGDAMRFTFQLLDHDAKRQHFFGGMYHAKDNYLAATHEWLTTHVDLTTRRSAEMPPDLVAAFASMYEAHRGLPRPERAGQIIGIRRIPAA
jgi:acyl-CoA thioester hydrolase